MQHQNIVSIWIPLMYCIRKRNDNKENNYEQKFQRHPLPNNPRTHDGYRHPIGQYTIRYD